MKQPQLAILAMLASVTVLAANWTWELPLDQYKRMDVFQRSQYDKAAALFKKKNYRAAVSEFEKFKVQFPDSDQMPYILFMIGHSQHNDKQRNAAIKTYNEVLDYFGDVIPEASASLYYAGVAHIENGDVRDGMLLLKEMVEDEDYHKHALAAGALRHLADNDWKNGNADDAVRYWKRVVSEFGKTNKREADQARDKVTDHYIKTRNYAAYESWRITDENRADTKHRKSVAQHVWHRAYHNFHGTWDKYGDFNRDEKKNDMQACHDWFLSQKTWYEQEDDQWGFYNNALLFAAHRLHDRPETKRLLDEVVPSLRKLTDQKIRNDRFAWLADRLREGQDFDNALYCVTMIADPPLASYKEYEILGAKGKWDAAVKRLQDIENMGNTDWAARALGERARVYKDVLRKYEEAIVLYQQLNNPPHNLWAIQECYRRWGKLKEALVVLSEIENMFPDHASNAAWHKASYLSEAGELERAVAQARRILKVYPKSSASSKAHQFLEKHGIATGGGVVEND